MKKGFTLVEMLIVVVVLVTLMSITFRLSSVGEDQTDKAYTISRLQRLENCLSGYYAAFGTYPPVKDHAHSRFEEVNSHGMQTGTEQQPTYSWYKDSGNHGCNPNQKDSPDWEDWLKVRALCMRQPVAMRFPYPDGYNPLLKAWSESARETDPTAELYDDGYTSDAGRHDLSAYDWQECQLFEFGLLSFLLPRYMIMMSGGRESELFFTEGCSGCQQWSRNNNLPCNPADGTRYTDWMGIKRAFQGVVDGASGSSDETTCREISMLPSQIVCRRWLPNLEKACYCGTNFRPYGVDLVDDTYTSWNSSYGCFVPGGANSSGGSAYQLDYITMIDGWGNELFYYSPPPYQSYVVWSGGPNGRSFPPWIDRSTLQGNAAKAVGIWIADDIVNMSN